MPWRMAYAVDRGMTASSAWMRPLVVAAGSSRRAAGWQRFRQHRLAALGLLVLVVIGVGVLAAPLSPYNATRSNLPQRFQAPSQLHPFGTDDLGRDQLTRTLVGGQISLAVGVLAVILSLTV